MTYGAGMGAEIDVAPCPSRQPDWVGVFGPIDGQGVIVERDAFFDSHGNIFLAGRFGGIVDLDPSEAIQQFESPPQVFAAFLLKLNADGSYAWTFVQQAPAHDADSVGVSDDIQGNAVLTTNLVLAPQVFAPRVTWLTHDGVPFRTVEFASGEYGVKDIAVAPSGAVYLLGSFVGTVDFDPGGEVDQQSSSGWDPYLTKLDADGSYAWTRTFGGPGFDTGVGVATDADGNVIITGTFRGSVDFDPGGGVDIHVQQGFIEDSFVTKFLADGSYGWTRTYPIRFLAGRGKPAVDSQGNVFFTHAFGGTMDFNPDGPGGEHTANGDSGDLIVVKLARDGEYVWSFSTSDGEGVESGFAVAIGANEDVYVTGTFRQTSDFDPGPGRAVIETTISSGSGFLLRLSSEGVFRSVMKLGEGGKTDPKYIGVAERDEPVVMGRFNTVAIDFDPSCEEEVRGVPPSGTSSMFVALYACVEPTADLNGDDFIELKEFARMSWCLTGPALAPGDDGDGPNEHIEPIVCHPGCAMQDLDADGDIDLFDLARFANAFTGAP